MKKIISLFLFSLALFSIVKAQSKEDKQLIKNVDGLLAARFTPATPGAVVLIAKKGQVVYQKAFGSANLELNVPMQPEMVFNLASITKQFTAVAILQLAEKGKLSLQDSVQKYVPGFPSKNYTITIEHLLTHTSGIKDYLHIGSAQPYMERWDFTPEELINFFKDLPLEFEPGTQYQYSNSGYALLGYIIEKLSGKSYAGYINDNILQPLELKNTYYDNSRTIIHNRVSGYYKEGNSFKNADYWSPSIAYSAGGLLSNAEDLFKWNRGLSAYKILKKESLDKAFTAYKLKNGTAINYGYGFIINTIGGIQSIEHGGSKNGFLTNEIYFPQQDIFVVLLFNSENAPRDELSIMVSALALGIPLQKEVKVAETILDSYVGTYMLLTDTKRTITITKEQGMLLAKLSPTAVLPLLFQSDTTFMFKNVLDANAEFKMTNGKVTSFIVDQHGLFEWKKME